MTLTLTISKKLTLSFVALTIVVLMATISLAHWSFKHGFLDYINALEQQRLQILAKHLTTEYLDADQDWSNLEQGRFRHLLRLSVPINTTEPRRPPPHKDINSAPKHRPPSGRGKADKFPPPPSKKLPPTALFDTNDQLIAGRSYLPTTDTQTQVPIVVQGEVVGVLKSAPRRHFNSPQETQFSKQQVTNSILISILSVALATIVAWFLTKVLLRPIRRITTGVSLLRNGDYSVRLNETGKDELGQLMCDLDHLALQLEESRSSRRRWLADISHELRTPITVLSGEIEILKDGLRPFDMQQVLSFDQEVSRLRYLINDLYELSLSDIGGLRYSFKPVDVLQSLSASVDSIRARMNEKNIDMQITRKEHVLINADSQRLAQLFNNLLENALAYTDSPGKIDISLTQTNNHVIINIEDTPPGVDTDEMEKLFDPLYRREASRNRRSAGAGLGLAICKNIVQAHSGTIDAHTSTLKGLCIQIKFPIFAESLHEQ